MTATLSKDLKAVRVLVKGHRNSLYDTLAAIYAFRVSGAANDDDKHGKWNKFAEDEYDKNKWKFTKATSNNMFTSAVRLAFETEPKKDEVNAGPLSKYAVALQELFKKKVGYKGTPGNIVPDTNIKGDAAKYVRANGVEKLASKKTGGGKGIDKSKAIEAGKKALDKLTTSFSTDVSKLLGTWSNDKGYKLVLAKVVKDNFQIIQEVATENDDLLKHYLADQAPAEAILDHPFGHLIMVLKTSFAIGGRQVIIDNSKDGAVATIRNPNKVAKYARVAMPHIEGLDEGRWVFPSAHGYLKIFSKAHQCDWEITKRKQPRVGIMITTTKADGTKKTSHEWGDNTLIANHSLTLTRDGVKKTIDLIQPGLPMGWPALSKSWKDKVILSVNVGSAHGQQIMAQEALVMDVIKRVVESAKALPDVDDRKNYVAKHKPTNYVLGIGSHGLQAIFSPEIVGGPVAEGSVEFEQSLDLDTPISLEMSPGLLSRAITSLGPVCKKKAVINFAKDSTILVSADFHGMDAVIMVSTNNTNFGEMFIPDAKEKLVAAGSNDFKHLMVA